MGAAVNRVHGGTGGGGPSGCGGLGGGRPREALREPDDLPMARQRASGREGSADGIPRPSVRRMLTSTVTGGQPLGTRELLGGL